MSVRELAFAIYGRRAGLIVRDRHLVTLRYDDDYLAWPEATPLSLSMPLVGGAYTARPVLAFLKGLLPDNPAVRERWARRFGVRAGDTLGLVAAIGGDTAGGAVFAAPDELDSLLARPSRVEAISHGEVAARLRQLREDDDAWLGESDEHWSLAGAQGKFTLVQLDDGGWGLASGSAPSTHIVKPGVRRVANQALAEHESMRTLALLGLEVAETTFVEVEDEPAVVVTRFDRRRQPAGVVRVHQEDLVQSHALDPSRKYEGDGGPGVARIVATLGQHAGPESVGRFVDATIAGYLLGAPDGHAKNYSVMLAGALVRLAPLYDVSTGLIPDAAGRLRYRSAAMSIGGEKRFGDVEATHWEKFAQVCRQPVERVRSRVAELAERLPDAFEAALGEVSGAAGERALRSQTLPLVAAVCEETARGLTRSRRVAGRLVTPFLDEFDRGSG